MERPRRLRAEKCVSVTTWPRKGMCRKSRTIVTAGPSGFASAFGESMLPPSIAP